MLLALAGGLHEPRDRGGFRRARPLAVAPGRDGPGRGWALSAGAAMGFMVTTRPVSGLLIGAAVTAGVVADRAAPGTGPAPAVAPAPLRLVGSGRPPVRGRFRMVQRPLLRQPAHPRLYRGPPARATGPRLPHRDPWGRMYGFTQALGYTSTELLSVGRELFGAALPVAALIGLYLLFARRLQRGERILAAWAFPADPGRAPSTGITTSCSGRACSARPCPRGPRFSSSRRSVSRARAAARGCRTGSPVLVLVSLGYGLAVGGAERVVRLGSRAPLVPEIAEPRPVARVRARVVAGPIGARARRAPHEARQRSGAQQSVFALPPRGCPGRSAATGRGGRSVPGARRRPTGSARWASPATCGAGICPGSAARAYSGPGISGRKRTRASSRHTPAERPSSSSRTVRAPATSYPTRPASTPSGAASPP